MNRPRFPAASFSSRGGWLYAEEDHPAVKERALRMVAEHRGEYASLTACCDQIGHRLGLRKETVRRWAVQDPRNR